MPDLKSDCAQSMQHPGEKLPPKTQPNRTDKTRIEMINPSTGERLSVRPPASANPLTFPLWRIAGWPILAFRGEGTAWLGVIGILILYGSSTLYFYAGTNAIHALVNKIFAIPLALLYILIGAFVGTSVEYRAIRNLFRKGYRFHEPDNPAVVRISRKLKLSPNSVGSVLRTFYVRASIIPVILILGGLAGYTANSYRSSFLAAVETESDTSQATVATLKPRALSGDVAAQFNLGRRYYLGQGVPKDPAEAVKWFEMAAQNGDAQAQGMLSGLYYDGTEVPKNIPRAVSWAKKAAAAGEMLGATVLMQAYMSGTGMEKNLAEAEKWGSAAVKDEPNNYQLQIALAAVYIEDQKWQEALPLLQKGVSLGEPGAEFLLGEMYANGWGLKKDDAKAHDLIKKSAAQGYQMAIDVLKRSN